MLWLLLLGFLPGPSNAGLDVTWDPVDSYIVEWYQVWYGTASGDYQNYVETSGITATIGGLEKGQTNYLAARSCNADRTRCSVFSNELEYTRLNESPTATNDSVTLAEDNEGNTISVLGNDSDPDDDKLSVTTASAGKGTVGVNANGTLNYSPQANFFGSDAISYTISDGDSGSDTATVAVTVTGVNDPPVATDDSATVAEDSTGNVISVLSNDTDIDGDILTVTSATASKGTVSANVNGALTYRAQPNFYGSDTISYAISDGNGGSDTASVAVTVTGDNDPPLAANDSTTVIENSADNLISVLENDTDIDGDGLIVISVRADTGDVSTDDNRTLIYSPQLHFFGNDTISYTISDGNGGTDTATVEVTVTAMTIPAPTGLEIVTSN